MTEDIKDDQNSSGQVALEMLQNDLNEALSGWKRTAADFENYKRRTAEQQKELAEFAREACVAKLLPTLDALSQALRHLPEAGDQEASELESKSVRELEDRGNGESVDQLTKGSADRGFWGKYKSWQTGISGILVNLDKVLSELGVKKIEARGKKFDPHLHEAVRDMESEEEEGVVVEELQSGYELNGKLIRPSQVIISKKKDD